MRRFNSAYYSIQAIAELTMKPVIKTISEVKDAKEHLEDQISCLLMQFEKDNGIHISDLSVYPREIYNEYGKITDRQIGTSIVVKL